MKEVRITPEQGKVYKNKGGGEFGSIEWDYSTGGHFENLQRGLA